MIDQYHFLPSSTGMIIPPVRVSIFIWYNVQTKLNGAQWRANEQEMTIFQARWRANEQLVGGWALATYLKNRVYDSSTRTPDTMKCGMIILLYWMQTTKDQPFAAQAFCILLSWYLFLEMVGGCKGFGLRMKDKLSDDSNVKEGDGKLSHHKLCDFINSSQKLQNI